MSSDQSAIFNEKHKEKLLFSGCDKGMKIEASHSYWKRDLFSSTAN
jgi:hypothetical protein